MAADPARIRTLRKRIMVFYKRHGRHDLPWRRTTDRYAILVSEVMLQQTQVERVIPKYEAWLEAFPTPAALAAAPLADVLRLWSGLGYNSRAKRLQDAARIIVERHDGVVPDTVEGLIALPGIGPYTARSVLIFADNADLATVDTNIRRILIHELGLQETIPDKELFAKAQEVLPKGRSRDWHNALMDYGSSILTARKSGIRPKTRQPPFKESRRYYRGQILKHLTREKELRRESMRDLFPDAKHDVEGIAGELADEGLIERKADRYVLKE